MSRLKTMSSREIKAELAYRGMTVRQLAKELDISYSYALKILQGRRIASAKRVEMTSFLEKESA